MTDAALIARVQAALTDDLRRAPYKGDPNPLAGHCYVATEALYHLLGPSAGWAPRVISFPDGGTHWFLQRGAERLDPTAGQFEGEPIPYTRARGCGFLTRQPSRRARVVIARVRQGA
jgi:hypothetical protein